jgi:hypothetical protein
MTANVTSFIVQYDGHLLHRCREDNSGDTPNVSRAPRWREAEREKGNICACWGMHVWGEGTVSR